MAARYIREALHACRSKDEVYQVLRVVVRLSEDIGKAYFHRFYNHKLSFIFFEIIAQIKIYFRVNRFS